MDNKIKEKYLAILRKFIVALIVALLLMLLGIFGRIGYYVRHIEELSFTRYYGLGYADATFSCDIIFNPVLYPFYWMLEKGHISGNFSTIYVPEAYSTGELGHAIWPPSPSDRYPEYILQIITWGILPNLLILFNITVAIEIVGRRTLYLLIFCGILGFFVGELLGAIIGLIAGAFLTLQMNKFIVQLWHSLWK
jgi:hypothetical protein